MKYRTIDVQKTSLRLKELFEKNNLSPKEVQEQLHLSSIQAVYKWMNPDIKTLPSLDNLTQLTVLLECTYEDILVTEDVSS